MNDLRRGHSFRFKISGSMFKEHEPLITKQVSEFFPIVLELMVVRDHPHIFESRLLQDPEPLLVWPGC